MAVHSWPESAAVTVPAGPLAQAVAQTWRDSAPHTQVDSHALGDGGPRTADLWDGGTSPVGGAVAVQTPAGLMLAPSHGLQRWDPPSLSSALLGLAAQAGAASSRHQVVIPVGDVPPAGDATDLWGGGLAAMRQGLSVLDMVALVGHTRPLLGFHGMSAGLRDGRETDTAIAAAAQEQEQRWGTVALEADQIASRTTLIGSTRLSDAPGSGAAGGLAYCLGALGARLTPASAWMTQSSGFADAVAGADVAVVVIADLTPATLDHIAAASAAAAAEHAVPTIVVTAALHVGKRDLMAAGIVSAYEADRSMPGLTDRIGRVARTWTPPPG